MLGDEEKPNINISDSQLIAYGTLKKKKDEIE